jgi:hypothetical protein
VFPNESSLNIDQPNFLKEDNTIYFKGYWKNNEDLINFLFELINIKTLPLQWFKNLVFRWDEDQIIDNLRDDYGELPEEWDCDDKDDTDDQKTYNPFDEISTEDESFIKNIIKGDFELDDKLDANKTAKIKTLLAIKGEYASDEISDEERYLKAGNDEIIVRSAQNGLLYLNVYHWGRLSEENVRLAVYTNNEIRIYDSQEELFKVTKPLNKLGILRMPYEYDLEDYNSLNDIASTGEWHFVFIVNKNTKAARGFNDFMNLDDYDY